METLIDFYKNVISSLKNRVNDEGYIYVGEGKGTLALGQGGKMIALPTKENIATLLDEDEDGNISPTKILYNPLKESAIKGNAESLNKTKQWAERRLGFSLAAAGEMLLNLARSKEFQSKTSLDINMFLSRLQEASNANIKEIVDDNMIDKWCKVYGATLVPDNSFITLYVSKLGKVKGSKFFRSTILSCKTYETLLGIEKEGTCNGVKLRKKDVTVFKIVLEYLLEGIEEGNHTLSVGSNDTESPGFVSLLTMYHNMITKFNSVLEELKDVNEEVFDIGYVDLHYTLKDLENLSKFSKEVAALPDETDINRSISAMTQSSLPKMDNGLLNKTPNKPMFPTVDVTDSPVTTVPIQQPVQTAQVTPVPQQPQVVAQPYVQPQQMHYANNVPYDAPMDPRNAYAVNPNQVPVSTEDKLRKFLSAQPVVAIPTASLTGTPVPNQVPMAPMGSMNPYGNMGPIYTQQQQPMGLGSVLNQAMVQQPPVTVQMTPYQGPMAGTTNSYYNANAPIVNMGYN